MTTRQKLEEAALVLENERRFYDEYTGLYSRPNPSVARLRNCIQRYARRAGFTGLDTYDLEALRLYFEDRYTLSTSDATSYTPSQDLLKPEPKPPKPAPDSQACYTAWLSTLLSLPGFKDAFLSKENPRDARDCIYSRLKGTQTPDSKAANREVLRLWLCNHYKVTPGADANCNPDMDWQNITFKPAHVPPEQPSKPPNATGSTKQRLEAALRHLLKLDFTVGTPPNFRSTLTACRSPQDARGYIEGKLASIGLSTSAAERETLRLWLFSHWGEGVNPDPCRPPAHAWQSLTPLTETLEAPAEAPATPETKETIMNAKPIELTTKTYLNGADLASMSDSDIYAQIQAQEDAIEKLQGIKAKPKSLLAEIEKRQEGINALVKFLDSK